ncbi:hypothetical protein KY289_026386 [Solanum tuberosum]|nr:hypothetical protein KY289_026386 [Solanum tuberosum]
MGRKALRKKVNCLIDNDDMVPPENSIIAPVKENLPTQHVEELIYRDDLKKHCKFDIFEGDKKMYLRGDRVINDYDGLVECGDDSDVRNMMVSYKTHKKKLIEIYMLSKNYNIVMSTSLGEHDPRDNTSEEVNEVIMEEHELANSAVRSRSCCPLKVNGWKEIEQDKIDHMWAIILEKFNFDVSEGKRDAIFGHMSDLYRDYRHKLKRNPNILVRMNGNIWSTFGVMLTFRREVCKTRQIDQNVPYLHILEPKVMQGLDMKWRKMEKLLLVLTLLYMESRKRKKGKQIDAFQQDVIDQFDQFKKQQEKGEISLNDDDIFKKVLGTEKNGYLRAYGPEKSRDKGLKNIPTLVEFAVAILNFHEDLLPP